MSLVVHHVTSTGSAREQPQGSLKPGVHRAPVTSPRTRRATRSRWCPPAVSPTRRKREDTVHAVNGTPVPTRDRSTVASREHHCYSTNLQAAIDADGQLMVAAGSPQPDSYNGCWASQGPDRHLSNTPGPRRASNATGPG